MKEMNHATRGVTAFDICSKKTIEKYVRGKLSNRESKKVAGLLSAIPELKAYADRLENKLSKEGALAMKLSAKGEMRLTNMLANLRKQTNVFFFPFVIFYQDLADQFRLQKVGLDRVLLASVVVYSLLPFFSGSKEKSKVVEKKVKIKMSESQANSNYYMMSERNSADKSSLPKENKITFQLPKNSDVLTDDIDSLDLYEDLDIVALSDTEPVTLKPIEPENPSFKFADIQAINLNPQTAQALETNGDWQNKLETIEPLKNSYTRQERRYQKLDIKVAEFIDKYRNKERVIGNSSINKKFKNNQISKRADRARKGQGTSKKDKVRNRRLAQKQRNKARRRGRKVVAWRKEMREAKKEMKSLQKEAITKTLILLVGNTNEYKKLDAVKYLTWEQVEGVMVGFALPKAPKEQLLFNLYQYDKTADNPKQLLVKATLQADDQGVIKQFVPLNQDFLLGKKGRFIIEITLKPKKYREKRLVSRSFQVGK
ncbi:MAG TPA: hypothetical protein DCS93_38200 [Microscillaceae bacterium]|nr:hypothetical protein [Microscillaceae bacterium]